MSASISTARWSPEAARSWADKRGWLVGANFAPSSAVNQLEMWQPETFDRATIDRELGWAAELGMNSMRVFTHHLLWQDDPSGLLARMDQVLQIAASHGIGMLFVLFDSVWNPVCESGRQPEPRPGVHNSQWVQSPGVELLRDPSRWAILREYVSGVVGRFANDPRVDGWDLVNEPDNPNPAYRKTEAPHKAELALRLVSEAFSCAWDVRPSQPLTVGIWTGDWTDEGLSPIARLGLESSDVISFHHYGPLAVVEQHVVSLRRFNRPMLCTEYMARPLGSRFDPVLGFFRDAGVGAYNWGLVAGRSQTQYPWDSWVKPYAHEPEPWFHDIFRPDGRLYDPGEGRYIRSLTGRT